MKKILLSVLLVSLSFIVGNSQQLKSPEEFLGYKIGTRFTPHYKVVDYFEYITSNSTMATLEKYGETNEHRPLVVTYISSNENLENIESIKKSNLQRTGSIEGSPSSNIAIVWLSYNVHGNEASSTEASMLTLYDLITNKKEWLDNLLVIMDPCINPDGRDRYVHWFNETKSTPFNTNPDAMEHNEPWPGGRPNHYMFDLNRDWAWLSQVESQQRIALYNKWLPQIHVDFHEQGVNSPYYFAPAAEPYHEIITDWQRDFQDQLGRNHASYFDKEGWLYFSKERFDLFYPSYGDTYPTYMGAIGMTYEQAGNGRSGLGIDIENNTVLTLIDRVQHHFTTGLSTVEMASKNATKLLNEFENFYKENVSSTKSYIVRGAEEKIKALNDLLKKHEISMFQSQAKTVKAFDYYSKKSTTIKTTSEDWVIPVNQPKGKMVKVLFDANPTLSDSLTYDITAWSLPYAYGLQGFETDVTIASNNTFSEKKLKTSVGKNYAYLHKWNEVSDGELLGKLLQAGFNVRFSTTDFSIENKQYKKGTLLVMKGENMHIADFDTAIVEIANSLGKEMTGTTSGYVDSGSDFGSNNMVLIPYKKIALIGGDGTSPYSFGEIWHFFEKQLHYPLHTLNSSNLSRINLHNYDVIILPNYFRADQQVSKKLDEFVQQGGNIIAIGSAVSNFADKDGYQLKKKNEERNKKPNLIPFEELERERIKNQITGSIFKSNVDNSHPLAFGYQDNYFSLKLSSTSYELLNNGFNVAYFDSNATNYSGFAGSNAKEKVPNSLLFGMERKGRGNVIYMVDNPLFRSFWNNGKLFVVNALFFN